MPSPSDPEPSSVRLRPALGCFVRIAARGAEAAAAIDAAYARIEAIEQAMSFHRADGELQRLHRSAGGESIGISMDLWRVLQAARQLWRDSEGWFDPSVARELVQAGLLPRPEALTEPETSTTLDALELPAPGQARLARPLWLDLGGIAKGYAVDQALQQLREAGMQSASVNAGGDLACYGSAETIGLRDPRSGNELAHAFELRDAAAATSGNYFRPGALRGRRGHPTRRSAGSITVLAADCMTADALTKLAWATPRRAKALLQQRGARALSIDSRGRLHWLQ